MTQEDWIRVRNTLVTDNDPAEVDAYLERQKEWLSIPETERSIIAEFGSDYTLEQAIAYLDEKFGDKRPEKRPYNEVMESAPSRIRKTPIERFFKTRPNSKFYQQEDEDDNPTAPADSEEFNARVKSILEGLLSQYSDVTPNDLAQITDYANCQAQSEYLHKRIAEYLASTGDKDNTVKIMRVRNVLDALNKTMREIEKLLAIDRTTRDKENQKTDIEEALTEMERAGDWVKNLAVKVIHCEILLGWYLPSFNEMALDMTFVCPKCKQVAEFHFIPTKEMIAAATEPDWVAEEESKYYKPIDELTERIVKENYDNLPDSNEGGDPSENGTSDPDQPS